MSKAKYETMTAYVLVCRRIGETEWRWATPWTSGFPGYEVPCHQAFMTEAEAQKYADDNLLPMPFGYEVHIATTEIQILAATEAPQPSPTKFN